VTTQSNNDDPSSMTIREIRHELESFGINMVRLFEKSEFIEVLVKARKERKAPAVSNVRSNTAASSISIDPASMGTKEIRRELESLGVSMVGLIEKSELIDALVNARKKGEEEGASLRWKSCSCVLITIYCFPGQIVQECAYCL
jgi:hypothetical protein